MNKNSINTNDFVKLNKKYLVRSSKMKLVVGDKVKLIDKKSKYVPRISNPTINTEFECPGTVIELSYNCVRVLWENGTRNSYFNEDLKRIGIIQQNSISIW